MIKMILGFLVLYGLVYAAIQGMTISSGREKIQLIKSLSYTMVVTVVVVSIIAAIVVLF
jgi:hypothetical protein